MNYVIITDIDHTLLNNNGRLLPENAKALQEAANQGSTIFLATARSYIGALPIYEFLELTTPLVVSNGTLITDVKGNILHSKNILAHRAAAVFDMLYQTPHHWVVRIANVAYLHPEFHTGSEPFNNKDFYKPLKTECLDKVLGNFERVVSLSLYGDKGVKAFCEENNWAAMDLRSSYYPPSYYNNKHALSLVSKQASKGNALLWLLKHLKLDHLPVLVMGDSPDDVSMFGLGISVAPSSGSEIAKEQADWVGPSCDEGVVAAAIEKYRLLSFSP